MRAAQFQDNNQLIDYQKILYISTDISPLVLSGSLSIEASFLFRSEMLIDQNLLTSSLTTLFISGSSAAETPSFEAISSTAVPIARISQVSWSRRLTESGTGSVSVRAELSESRRSYPSRRRYPTWHPCHCYPRQSGRQSYNSSPLASRLYRLL